MPGVGRYRLEFVGPTPRVFQFFVWLLIVNSFGGLAVGFFVTERPSGFPACDTLAGDGLKHQMLSALCWYADGWLKIMIFLAVCLIALLFVFWKRLRYRDAYTGRRL
jgi:hypothetical protein